MGDSKYIRYTKLYQVVLELIVARIYDITQSGNIVSQRSGGT